MLPCKKGLRNPDRSKDCSYMVLQQSPTRIGFGDVEIRWYCMVVSMMPINIYRPINEHDAEQAVLEFNQTSVTRR